MDFQRRKMKSLIELELKSSFFWCSGCLRHAVKCRRLFLRRWEDGGPWCSCCVPPPRETREDLQQWQVGALPMCNTWKAFPFLVLARILKPVNEKLPQALLRVVYAGCTIRQKIQWNEGGFLKYIVYFPASELNNFRISAQRMPNAAWNPLRRLSYSRN